MHAFQLAELAGWLSLQAPSLTSHEGLATLLADRYWVVSKCRSQRWQTAIRMFADDIEASNQKLNEPKPNEHNPWPALNIVAEEIMFSEMLTRVWSAVIAQHDKREGSDDLSVYAHGVLISQIEARNRVFQLILSAPKWAEEITEQMNQIRRSVERWTDLLLSQLESVEAAKPFAFDEKRLLDFYCDRKTVDDQVRRRANQLLVASLTTDLKSLAGRFPANPDLNRKIASGILACFPNDPLASGCLPNSVWMMQLDSFHSNANELIEELAKCPVSDDAAKSSVISKAKADSPDSYEVTTATHFSNN